MSVHGVSASVAPRCQSCCPNSKCWMHYSCKILCCVKNEEELSQEAETKTDTETEATAQKVDEFVQKSRCVIL